MSECAGRLTRSDQGQTAATRWQWNNTVGPSVDRPGRLGDWSYVNTECARLFAAFRPLNLTVPGSGLGLLEYLQFIEDVGMQPIMAVWSGEYSSRDVPTWI